MPHTFQVCRAMLRLAACLGYAFGVSPEGISAERNTNSAAWWSLQPVRQQAIPATKSPGWIRTPPDAFVLAALEHRGLRPAHEADRRDWVRRVTYDLTGLPPTEYEVAAFCADTRPDAFERWVDRLMERPAYGERFAQHWLDVVRYAETEGFEYDRHIPGAWRYRDYVVDSLNRGKPYDAFVREQLAGDEGNAVSDESRTAAVFHRLGPVRRNAGNPEIALSRNEVLTERTDILGSAFIGLTVGCARCHDHKLDPILQKDYYRLQAYVAATQEDDHLLIPSVEKELWENASASIQEKIKRLRAEADDAEGERRVMLRKEIEALERKLPPQPPTIPSIKNDMATRTPIHVLVRGEWERKGERVGPRPLSVLVPEGLSELPETERLPRTALTDWLVDPAHPLTARVLVNRVWQWHFGTGLVSTPNDFGTHGAKPSHPELLDWLAVELVRNGWRIKPIQRLLVLSAAYRQASNVKPTSRVLEIDPENRLLWRFNRRRLSAEEIRDSMLAAAGVLNPTFGGPGIMIPVDPELVSLLYKPSQWEGETRAGRMHLRSIYLVAKRNLRLPFMEVFDQPALLTSCGRRESSTHAPQALELLNGALSNGLARQFTRRLEAESGGDRRRFVERAFVLTMGRPPDPSERRRSEDFLKDQPAHELALAMFNLNEFLHVP